MIYELFEDKQSQFLALATFLPQLGLILISSVTLYHDLFLCIFI
jgi:hypothetical protein